MPHSHPVGRRRLPCLGWFHPYAWWSFVLASLCAAQVALTAVLFLLGSKLAFVLLDVFVLVMLFSAISIGLALHTASKYWWPGRTATERRRKPVARDLVLASVAAGLASTASALLVAGIGRIGAVFGV